MRPALRRRMITAAAAGVIAIAGAGVAVYAASAGSSAPAHAAARPAAAAAPVAPAEPAPVTTAPASPTASPGPSSKPKIDKRAAAEAAKPPPVVDGVKRTNVAAAHSPQLARAMGGSSRPAPALPATQGTQGVDVASYEHPDGAAIDWAQVAAAGYKFAFVKASEGNYYSNPYYADDVAGARAAGLDVAGYEFAAPDVSSGTSQADYAVQHAGSATSMPLGLDIEYDPYGGECYGMSAASMVAWLSAFTTEARRLTGQLPVIYSTADWWDTCTGDSTAFGADPLWIASWGSSAGTMPAGWKSWAFWQYTSSGKVPGISGNADLDFFRQAAASLPAPAATSSPSPSSSPSPAAPAPATPPPAPASSTPAPASSAPAPAATTPAPAATTPAPAATTPAVTDLPDTPATTTGAPAPADEAAAAATPAPAPGRDVPSPH